jgi:hypothetical protein
MARLLDMAIAEQSLDIGQIMCPFLYTWDHIIYLAGSLSVKSHLQLEQTRIVA